MGKNKNKVTPVSADLVAFNDYVLSINETSDNGNAAIVDKIVADPNFDWHAKMPKGDYFSYTAIDVFLFLAPSNQTIAESLMSLIRNTKINWCQRRDKNILAPIEMLMAKAADNQNILDVLLELREKHKLEWTKRIPLVKDNVSNLLCVVMQALNNNLIIAPEILQEIADDVSVDWGAETTVFTQLPHPIAQTALFLLVKAALNSARSMTEFLLEAVLKREELDWLQDNKRLQAPDERHKKPNEKACNQWRPLAQLFKLADKDDRRRTCLNLVLAKNYNKKSKYQDNCYRVANGLDREVILRLFSANQNQIAKCQSSQTFPEDFEVLLQGTKVLAALAIERGYLNTYRTMVRMFESLGHEQSANQWKALETSHLNNAHALFKLVNERRQQIQPLSTHHQPPGDLVLKDRDESKANNHRRREQIWDAFETAMQITDVDAQEKASEIRRELAGMFIYNKSFGTNRLDKNDPVGGMHQGEMKPDMAKALLDEKRKVYLAEKKLRKLQMG